jgi:hypothetical protein
MLGTFQPPLTRLAIKAANRFPRHAELLRHRHLNP